jgi:hypothetical protein
VGDLSLGVGTFSSLSEISASGLPLLFSLYFSVLLLGDLSLGVGTFSSLSEIFASGVFSLLSLSQQFLPL